MNEEKDITLKIGNHKEMVEVTPSNKPAKPKKVPMNRPGTGRNLRTWWKNHHTKF